MTRSSRSAHAGGDRSIFERSVVPMWEEDISRLRELIAEWRKQAGNDLRGYLRARPALVREGVHAIQVVDVNSAALELYEAESKKDLLGALDATLDPGALETFVELFAAIAEGRGHVESESTARTLSGRKLDVLVKTFIPGPQDAHSAMVVNVVDFTEYKELKKSLQEQQALVRSVIDNIPDLVFLKDAEGRFLVANQAMADTMHAGTPERLIGKTDFDFYPRRMAEEFAADERRLMETGSSIVNKEEPKVVDGQTRWILTTKVPLFDDRGKATGIVGVGRDVSSLKEAQEALAGSEDRYRTLVEDIGVGILSTDAAGAHHVCQSHRRADLRSCPAAPRWEGACGSSSAKRRSRW